MGCDSYPKIDTLYERDESFKVDTTKLRRSEFAIPREWLVTEKIDGTNVRVSLQQECNACADTNNCGGPMCSGEWFVRFFGRTENSQMPTFLLEHLQRTFTLSGLSSLWRDGQYPITLYGEGYGAKIQKGGGNYRRDGDVSFRLFDVLIGDTWLSRTNVEDVAEQLGIKAVPKADLGRTLNEITQRVCGGIGSVVGNEEGTNGVLSEGVVAFTDPPLFNGQGKKLCWKLKTKDFA